MLDYQCRDLDSRLEPESGQDVLDVVRGGSRGDDELGRVAERRVQEATECGAGALGEMLGRLPHQPGERQDADAGGQEDRQRLGVRPGGMIRLQAAHGTESIKVAAITNEYMVGGMSIHMHRDHAVSRLGITGFDAFVLRIEPEYVTAVKPKLEAICKDHDVLLKSYAEISSNVSQIVGGIEWSLWLLVYLGFVVAAFVNSFERPDMPGKEKDYPDLMKKPVDSPYGPYADAFPEEQHKYGPFQPIEAWYEERRGATGQ